MLSAQQIAVFRFLGEVPGTDGPSARAAMEKYKPLLIEPAGTGGVRKGSRTLATTRPLFRPKRSMVFVWQCPVMFMSYSVCLFLLGLTLLVITPLIKLRERGWSDGANVTKQARFVLNLLTVFGQTAIFYLGASVLAGLAFLFCSFWIYHFVDFENDISFEGSGTESLQISPNPVQEPGSNADLGANALRSGEA